MSSPIPGVDPYLEQYWRDIHTSLMVYIRDQIDEQLPSGLQARVEESVNIDLEVRSRMVYPDVTIVENHNAVSGAVATVSATDVIAEPILVPVNESPTKRHLEIVDLNSGCRVVTAIELLSPCNKIKSAGREEYVQKQKEYIAGQVNLVEIDLIRAGTFTVAAPEARAYLQSKIFMICIRRVTKPMMAEIIPIALGEPIPAFRVPLRPEDADIVLRLQPLLDDCYRRGRYASIDYTKPPSPSLSKDEDTWLDGVLNEKGLRPK